MNEGHSGRTLTKIKNCDEMRHMKLQRSHPFWCAASQIWLTWPNITYSHGHIQYLWTPFITFVNFVTFFFFHVKTYSPQKIGNSSEVNDSPGSCSEPIKMRGCKRTHGYWPVLKMAILYKPLYKVIFPFGWGRFSGSGAGPLTREGKLKSSSGYAGYAPPLSLFL